MHTVLVFTLHVNIGYVCIWRSSVPNVLLKYRNEFGIASRNGQYLIPYTQPANERDILRRAKFVGTSLNSNWWTVPLYVHTYEFTTHHMISRLLLEAKSVYIIFTMMFCLCFLCNSSSLIHDWCHKNPRISKQHRNEMSIMN